MRGPRSHRQRLEHIRDCARRAWNLGSALTLEEYVVHDSIPLACQKLIETIGEAANRLPDEVLARMPGIPWRQIIGLRHRLVHDYDDIDDTLIWQIIQQSLPELEREVTQLLASSAI